MAIRSIKELLFMHQRVDKPTLRDPPKLLPENKAPKLAISRAQFVKEAEKEWKVSELLFEDVVALESDVMLSGSVRLQSETTKAMRWMRLDALRHWFVESWAPTMFEPVPELEIAGAAGVAGAEPVPNDQLGFHFSFKMLADIRQKLQHEQEVPPPFWSFFWVGRLDQRSFLPLTMSLESD